MYKLYGILLSIVVIVLITFPSCDDSVKPEKNQPPVIESISSSPSTSSSNRLPGGTTFQISVVATDPDRDALSYIWQADEGQFEGEIDRPTIRWKAPISDREKDYVIKVTVSDGALSVQGDITIYVDKAVAPAVTTVGISNITETSARGGGEVTDDGGTEVTARGIVWSRPSNPTLQSNEGFTTDGSGTGTFTSNLTGLNPGTTYYVRAYATNSQGTAYGNQVSFRTGGYQTGTVTDIDGNVYQTVKIGEQWWMAENLKTTRYRNGAALSTNLDNTQWGNTTSGAYAIYSHGDVDGINSDEEMVDAYGKLYNWYAVDDSRGLCPTEWHVPSDAEWTTLTNYLGGLSIAGGKMKSTRTEPDAHPRWNSPNTGATNESGWSGLPGGGRGDDGDYDVIGDYGYWWSSTETNTLDAWFRNLNYDYSNVDRYNDSKPLGFSVRCLRDD